MMTVLLTAGPTREPLDPVRYLSNHSSGKMGYSIAEAAAKKGCRVILVSGPTNLDIPDGVDYIPVETALEMHQAVGHWVGQCDIAIFTAAVADFRIAEYSEQKIKKSPGQETMTLELVKNVDILASVRADFKYEGLLVGFAAETENVLENARLKLQRKGCDLIFANDVSNTKIGFNSDQNALHLISADKEIDLGEHSKAHLADLIMEHCLDCQESKS